ncbi:MAG: hypothetical protein J6O18_08840 [Bacilli bacterium]|nr:hypothetical protein [Bacilli bacterium]
MPPRSIQMIDCLYLGGGHQNKISAEAVNAASFLCHRKRLCHKQNR